MQAKSMRVHEPLAVDRLTKLDQLRGLRAEWDDLLEEAESASVFQPGSGSRPRMSTSGRHGALFVFTPSVYSAN